MTISFFVPGLPIAQPRQRHRVVEGAAGTFVSNYTPAGSPVNAFKALVRLAASQACDGVLSGPVGVTMACRFPMPKGKRRKKGWTAAWKETKPDLDNLEKAVLDALTGIAWHDDAQVAHVSKWKVLASSDQAIGVHVRVVSLGLDDLPEIV